MPSPSPNQSQFSPRDRTHKPSILISTDFEAEPESVHPSATSVTSASQSLGVFSPTHSVTPNSAATFASLHASRYPGWLSHVVQPLSEFIDSSLDPRELFADLQEIAEGESGSVFSARVLAPPPTHRFVPPTPTSPFRSSAARQQQAQDMVALKAIPIAPEGSPKLLDLRRELELVRGVRHPNVLKMEGVYVDLVEDSLWIGMELMERSLADVLGIRGDEDGEAVAVGEKMVARFVWDVLLALSYLRKQRIAHRDLRSDNLLLSKDGVLKLADFSSAVRVPPNAKCSDVAGVVYWQAPEIRKGRYDPLKVDVWSLGATTWELVHGEPPFADVQDPRLIGSTLPPVADSDLYSRSFHDFLHLCSQPVASRPDPDELLNAHFIRTACPRSAIVHLLGQCRVVEEKILRRQSVDSQGTFTMP
ncbi:kinase-like domain-containing protein [Amylostereum chailletii]|nr:kinase-like domain-containing protein [Amylostereum chailletii]